MWLGWGSARCFYAYHLGIMSGFSVILRIKNVLENYVPEQLMGVLGVSGLVCLEISNVSEDGELPFFLCLVTLSVFLRLSFVQRNIYLGNLLWSCCRFVESLWAVQVGYQSDVPLLLQFKVCWCSRVGIVFCLGYLCWLDWGSAQNLCVGDYPGVIFLCYDFSLHGVWVLLHLDVCLGSVYRPGLVSVG